MTPRILKAERVLDARAELGEGARWDARTSSLLWVDILRGELHRFDPASGRDVVRAVGRHIGAVAPRKRGGWVAAVREGFVTLHEDGREDRAGRFWADSLHYDHSAGKAALFRLDADGSARPMVEGLWLGNGLDWSPDDRFFYLVDTLHHRVDVFDFDLATGELSARRPFLDVPKDQGHPDGLTVDSDGCLWVALFGGGGVQRYTPDGRLAARVEVPGVEQITSCGFGGTALDTLYVTTARENLRAEALARQPHAGGLFAVRAGVRGQPTAAFAG